MADPATWALIGTAAKGAAVGTAATAGTATTAGAAATSGLFGAGGAMSMLQTVGTLSKVGSAMQLFQGGSAQQDTAKFQIEQEKIRARDESIMRREKLLDALSQQNARVGASGITSIGTPQNIAATDIARFKYEDLSAGVSSRNMQRQLGAQGQNAKKSGILGAGMSLLDTASTLKQIG